MFYPRYKHTATFYEGKLLLFGGYKHYIEDDERNLLKSCEYFDCNL